MAENLAQALVDFKEDIVLSEVGRRLDEGENPILIIRDLQEGMRMIGDRFKAGEFFLSELLMSADVFTKSMAVLEPKLEGQSMETIGKMVIGTPKGDLHDIGKNIFITVAKAAGFEIHDLGVDVPPAQFVEAVENVKPQVLGFSALITPAFEAMKETVGLLVEKGLREDLKIIAGGGVVTQSVMNYIGADCYTSDAMEGLNQCREMLEVN